MSAPPISREAVKKSYNQIAKGFSATRQHAWPEFDFFNAFIHTGVKVLDLGCGNGRLYSSLEHKQVDYTGVDFSEGLIEIARKQFPEQEFIIQDMTELDLGRRYDVIISIAAFHHLPSVAQRLKALKHVFRHLEDDGVFLISVWNIWQWRYWRAHVTAWKNWIVSGFRQDPRDLNIPFGPEKVPRYYHAFLPFELSSLVRKAGFRIEESRYKGRNFLLVCRKHMGSTKSHPLFVNEPSFSERLRSAAPSATCKRLG